MKKFTILLVTFLGLNALAQNNTVKESEVAVNDLIKGTLFTPANPSANTKLVIIIAGSGPTDRNGNQAGMNNNALKMLAQSIAQNGNAAYSYDKRILAMAKTGKLDESSLNFEDFIKDAKDVIAYFKAKKTYSKIIVAGHSEGSLIGMEAANGNADGYISIAGSGRPIDQVIMDQLKAQPQQMRDSAAKYFAILKDGKTFKLDDPSMAFLFRESVQPYMISWMKYKPQQDIKALKIPVLLVNGTKDLQVAVSEAELLHAAKPDATLELIPNMNHVLKTIENGDAENAASYGKPDLPENPKFLTVVNQFIKSI
ncbi:MAG: alpha/beta hydrolase [Flavobacterium sp. BFFFF1]|uniref:alpha/beta hydrolase n=1 Tax=Flavobacterium sp. BFFFF1 TaxID=2015557 RepID=UPI000BCE4C75|nr:alpha/beta fold hydrolase [Flavobacterium sp. BFFFF1]OYU80842.1 MAG: alpha/beta hydrolase [Flavobacterium sp. BFFFF1]